MSDMESVVHAVRRRATRLLGMGVRMSAAFSIGTTAAADEIGRAATQDDIQGRNLTVLPSGAGLPAGQGSVSQGRVVYQAKCAACHGANGEGVGEYPALVGGRGSLGTATPVLTVGSYWPYSTTVWDYIRRAMPYETPGSLSHDEVYAVTAWLLHANGIVPDTATLDHDSLPQVPMPNRKGFVVDPRPDVKPPRKSN